MKRFLISLIASISYPLAVNAGIPLDKDTWVPLDELGEGIYQINTGDAKAIGSKVTVGVSRNQGENEQSDGYYIMSWTGKVKVDCKKFKYTITAKAGGRGLFSSSSTYKITKNDIGYQLADNLCYLTGVEGYTKNDFMPDWALKVIKTIESKPIKKYTQQGSVKINCDSPVWKKRPICN